MSEQKYAPMTINAARVLSDIASVGWMEPDAYWNEYSDQWIPDAQTILDACGATELLEAAIELKDVCNRPSAARTRAEAWKKLDAAIAKATGGKQ